MRITCVLGSVLVFAAGCSGPGAGAVDVSILEVQPPEVARGGGSAEVSWQARSDASAVYYSLVVGAAETTVASGRVAPGVVQSDTVAAGLLDPCANRLLLRVVSPSGASDQDSAEIFLCPTEECGGCTGVVDGDADADVDVDADSDGDSDSDADAEPCESRVFPNHGECDPVTSDCCEPTESCEPTLDGTFVERCQPRAGTAGEGSSCGGDDTFCRRGLTCVYACPPWCDWQCTGYCRLDRGNEDCAPTGACSTIDTSYGQVDNYGACVE